VRDGTDEPLQRTAKNQPKTAIELQRNFQQTDFSSNKTPISNSLIAVEKNSAYILETRRVSEGSNGGRRAMSEDEGRRR
jgi:hypothetical protein